MSKDIIITIIVTGLALWGLGWIDVFWAWLKLRKVINQVARGIVPVDYDTVALAVRALNNRVELGDPKFRQNLADLNFVRRRVALIRVRGYDKAQTHMSTGMRNMAVGIQSNPYDNGSGESKQWVRGYCMASGAQPKQWMDQA